MYPITSEVLALFKANTPQKCMITVQGQNSTITITESSLKGLSFTRKSTTESNPYIGACVASELEFTLINSNGAYNSFAFEGAECFVQIGVTSASAETYYIPCGYFIVDTVPRRVADMSIQALDRMMLFDKFVGDEFYGWFPCSAATLLRNICQACNVSLAENYSGAYIISSAPTDSDLTYRQVLSWICEILGKCAYMDWEGKLRLDWYHSTSDYSIAEADRYTSDIMDYETAFTGVKIVQGDTSYLSGTDECVFNLNENSLIQDNPTSIFNNISLIDYYSFSANTVCLPHLYPMDYLTFTKGNTSYKTYITGIVYTLNGQTQLEGVGDSAQTMSYAQANPLTNSEKVIISKVKDELNAELERRIQQVTALNELVYNAMGFWRTTETQSDGSQIMYMHDAASLADSKKVWRMSAGTFAWTDNYNGQLTAWQNGISASGDAWFRQVSAIGLVLSNTATNFNSEFTPDAWFIKNGSMYAMQVSTESGEVQMKIPKLVVDNPGTQEVDGYIEDGKIRITPFNVNGSLVGTGIIQLD